MFVHFNRKKEKINAIRISMTSYHHSKREKGGRKKSTHVEHHLTCPYIESNVADKDYRL